MNIDGLVNQWFPIARLKDVSAKPTRFFFFGKPIVLYRHQDSIIALQDRCPHRAAPLSAGKIKNGILQCPYHGWSFDPSGRCMDIPGLCLGAEIRNKNVPCYLTKTHMGLVFVCLKKDDDTQAPYCIPALSDPNMTSSLIQFELEGDILNLVENVLDATHTHFVHAGLIRIHKKRHPTVVQINVDKNTAEACYQDTHRQPGLLGRLEGNRQQSVGRFVFPLVAELEYYSKKGLSVAFTFFLTPIAVSQYRVFLLVSHKKNIFTRLTKMLLYMPFIKKAAKQDVRILKMQADNLSFFPDIPFSSTQLDVLRVHIERIIRRQSSAYTKTLSIRL